MNNRGTFTGDLAEIELVKRFNKNKSNSDFLFYIKNCDIKKLDETYMVRVKTQQFSKLSNQNVMTRADTYLINSKDELIKNLLFENNYYLDENIIESNNINYISIDYSGVSVKMSDSDNFQILKLTPESFKTLFGEYEIGAGASVFCLHEDEIFKNELVFNGWHTTKEKVIEKYKKDIPSLAKLSDSISISEQANIYKELKMFSNKYIEKLVNENKMLQEIIFNGYHIYNEPYSASYFYHGNKIEKLTYIPFTITTGSGRSKGIFTIVLKPKKETIY